MPIRLEDSPARHAGMAMALRGGALQVDAVRGAIVLHGDRRLLTAAVVGVAQALFALGELVQDPKVVVRLRIPKGGGASCWSSRSPRRC